MKPEFFQHEDLYDLEAGSGLPVRVAFAGLWTQADREGRFQWRPRKLKVNILPYDDVDFSRVLDALWTRGFIEKYESEGAYYGWIPSFTSHQVLNNRERDSELPDPHECCILTRAPRVDDACPTPGKRKGKEGKGREQGREGDIVRQAAPNGGARFDEFWALYPRQRDKKKAREIWKRRKLAQQADVICDDVQKRQKIDGQWLDGYIPLPTTYLNNDRWEDEYSRPRKPKDGGEEWLEESEGNDERR